MSVVSVTAFDAGTSVPDFSMIELAIVIVFSRHPGIDLAGAAAEISRWFKADINAGDLARPLRRLVHREWVTTDGVSLLATTRAREMAEFAGRGLVHLIYRDR
jgi:hypothetical protein